MTLRRLLPILAVAGALSLAGPAGAQTAADIAAVQAWLNAQGYDAGPADGLMGGRTANAIAEWQAERGWPVSGEITPELVALATGSDEAAEPGAEVAAEPAADSAAADAGAGPAVPIEGTGDIAFTELDDGALLVTDGIPWRPGVEVPPRTIEIVGHAFGLFSAAPDSAVPVPYEQSVVELPGGTFVPLMLALDREGAAKGSYADAPGVTWRFAEGDLRFELEGWVLVAPAPGATIAFREDGVLLRGFELMPE